jgi:hypothetical protein
VILYGCETWSLTLKEHRLKAFENRVLGRISGPYRDKVTGGWRKLHNDKLCNLYSLSCIIRMVKAKTTKWTGYVAQMGEKRNMYRLSVGKLEGKRPLGRPRHMWVNNIKMDFGEVGWGFVDWIGLAQDRDK